MQLKVMNYLSKGETIGVALSGGSDSMALLHYLTSVSKTHDINVVAINVEHGIRGQESKDDTAFVQDYCLKHGVPLFCYSVDCIKKSQVEGLSIEQAARILRYECFYNAIESGKCDKIATAHHKDDNVESVLFNLFRGTGTKGLTGIKDNFENKIIRPFLTVSKCEIENYVQENDIPFVIDKTNFSDEYTRNYLRLNVIPEIKKLFPKLNDSITRLSEIIKFEDDYLDTIANSAINVLSNTVEIALPLHRAIFMRAVVKALKVMGVEKDWEFVHLSDTFALTEKNNGAKINLPKNVCAVKEYDKIVFYKEQPSTLQEQKFAVGEFLFNKNKIKIVKVDDLPDLKSGLFGDLDKISAYSVIRHKKDGDLFTKFGGGTKNLGDYFTDKKIPLRERDNLPILADNNEVLCVFGVAISDKIKIDEHSKNIVQFIIG